MGLPGAGSPGRLATLHATLGPMARVEHSRQARRLAPGAIVLLALGCGRTYRPLEPSVMSGPVVNATAYRVEAGGVPGDVTVRVRTTAIEGASLRGARLAARSSPACSGGRAFHQMWQDGAVRLEGPVDIAGSHDLGFVFAGPEAVTLLGGPATLDLELEGPGGRSCARIDLLSGPDDPRWKVTSTAVGASAGFGARAYPAVSHEIDGTKPGWSVEERIAISFGRNRLLADLAADTRDSRSSGLYFVVLGAEVDRALWERGRWAVWLGAGYDLALFYKRPETQTAGPLALYHALHGPRITPALSFALLDAPYGLPVYGRHLAIRLEARAPTAMWLGTGDAPRTTFVMATGLALTLDM